MEKDELQLKEELKNLKQQVKKRRNEENAAFKQDKLKCNAIYIWNLNKQNTTEKQLITEFSKFGVIKKDQANLPRCKLYRDSSGKPKGDALIVYARHESVPIAIDMMNGCELNGAGIKVEAAQFQYKKRKLEDLDHEEKNDKYTKHHHNADENTSDCSAVVVIRNILNPDEDYHQQELDDIKRDVLDGCLEMGRVMRIDLNSVTGEAKVNFQNDTAALNCCKRMNNRYFDGRRLSVYIKREEERPSDDSDDDRENALQDSR